MWHWKTFSIAAAAAMLSTASSAADLMPSPFSAAPPLPLAVSSGWYLRGYLGASNEFLSDIAHPDFLTAQQHAFLDKGGFDSAPFGGGGIGYQWVSWFRTDVTVEYRGKAGFHALDRFVNPATGAFNSNSFTASKSEVVALANMFLDLGTWWYVTPFIGAGAGASFNKIENFREVSVLGGSGGNWADTGTETRFAWALHAGLAYKVTPTFAIELSYRYLHLGDGQSGLLLNLDPSVIPINPLTPVILHNVQSNDIMLAARWLLQP